MKPTEEILFPEEVPRGIRVHLQLGDIFILDVRAGAGLCPALRAARGAAVPSAVALLGRGVNGKAAAGVSKCTSLISSDKRRGAPDLWPHFTGH